jgi:hypothetical protein
MVSFAKLSLSKLEIFGRVVERNALTNLSLNSEMVSNADNSANVIEIIKTLDIIPHWTSL